MACPSRKLGRRIKVAWEQKQRMIEMPITSWLYGVWDVERKHVTTQGDYRRSNDLWRILMQNGEGTIQRRD